LSGMYDKSDALIGWAKREVSSFAMRHLGELVEHKRHWDDGLTVVGCPPCDNEFKRRQKVGGEESARLWVASISDYQRDTAADLGTRVHAAAEEINLWGNDASIADDVRPYAEQYRRWLAADLPDILEVEYMGVNLTHGYGGTGDIIAIPNRGELDGKRVAIDIKTFTKPGPIKFYRGKHLYYPTTGMQLAACSRFEFIGREGDANQYPIPAVDAHAVLLIGSEDYRLIPYRVTDQTFETFLACKRLLDWKHGEGKSIVDAA
jgi:hypothetical protein